MATDEPNTAPAKVLIADDNPQILELLEAYLDPLPVRVTTAIDGQEALVAVERELPDLILLDIMMPKRSGFEVCRSLKDDARYRDVPIVMVTALNEVGDVERARECGADEFITKPVNKIELLELVRNLLQLRQLKHPPGEADG
ncbi:MAG: response regulator [Phycisphaerae bacterium]|nr:response regulator [Phycisphaerae bacterium]